MLAARELLTLIMSMVGEFRQWGRDAVPEATVHAQCIAIVCMLRSVGHVAQKVDCVTLAEARFLQDRWRTWKQDEIFQTFIEPARNDLLKEFKSRLELRRAGVSRGLYVDPGAPSGMTVAVNFEAGTLTDVHGRQVMPLFEKAVLFWDHRLREIEAFRAKGTEP
jgi:hypothetical protein